MDDDASAERTERFARTRLLLGDEHFARLNACHVAVIGLGAVGGYAVEGLARAGVGRLTLVDFDIVQPANINRQILALDSTIGRSKVETARLRVSDINPCCRVQGLELFVDERHIERILDLRPDILIDAIDSLHPKVQLLRLAHHAGITIFSSMGAALRTDPGLVSVSDIGATTNCPLARRIRKRLKGYGIRSGITCVYSTEPVDFHYQPPASLDSEQPHPPQAERGRPRRTLGSLPTLTAIFGLTLANEVIRHLGGTRP